MNIFQRSTKTNEYYKRVILFILIYIYIIFEFLQNIKSKRGSRKTRRVFSLYNKYKYLRQVIVKIKN